MEHYKQQFIEFMVRSQVLTFGDFVTKSGRKTPFFINTGKYKTGEQIKKLGEFYAEAICAQMPDDITVLFGPAYKGIPLVVTTAIALSAKGRNTAYCFNRKEAKDHGEGGTMIGHKLVDSDKVLLIDDVVTAGTSVREVIPLIRHESKSTIAGLIVSVDRMEKGTGNASALQEIHVSLGLTTGAIVTLDDIVNHLYNRPVDGIVVLPDDIKKRIDDYRTLYGAVS